MDRFHLGHPCAGAYTDTCVPPLGHVPGVELLALWQLHGEPSEKLPGCSPKQPHQFTLPPATHEGSDLYILGSNVPTSLPTLPSCLSYCNRPGGMRCLSVLLTGSPGPPNRPPQQDFSAGLPLQTSSCSASCPGSRGPSLRRLSSSSLTFLPCRFPWLCLLSPLALKCWCSPGILHTPLGERIH